MTEMRSTKETPHTMTFAFRCSCGAEGDLTLQKSEGCKSFGCPEGCGNKYVPYMALVGWRLRCVVERVIA
jgi:hypothetical protein